MSNCEKLCHENILCQDLQKKQSKNKHPGQHQGPDWHIYSSAKTKGNTLVHMECTTKCTNYYITLQAKCTLSCTPSALTVTFHLRLTVINYGSLKIFCLNIEVSRRVGRNSVLLGSLTKKNNKMVYKFSHDIVNHILYLGQCNIVIIAMTKVLPTMK